MGGSQSFPMVPLTEEKVVVVTGATSGIGYEIAKWCAMMGAKVILACRSEEKTLRAVEQMNHEFEVEKARGTRGLCEKQTLALEFMKLDLASFKSVLKFCEDFRKSGLKLHVLVCNAGLGLGPYVKTEDNLELLLQVNYLSHFIVIGKLLGIMKESGPDCRILLMSSAAHKAGTFDVATMNYEGVPDKYPRMNYYGRSKLYQVMQAAAFARRLAGSAITINSIHPGIVDTEFGSQATSCWRCLIGCTKCMGLSRTPLEGAKCGIDLVVNPKHAGVTGLYWVDGKVTTPSGTARDVHKQETMWKETLKFVGQYLSAEEIEALEGK